MFTITQPRRAIAAFERAPYVLADIQCGTKTDASLISSSSSSPFSFSSSSSASSFSFSSFFLFVPPFFFCPREVVFLRGKSVSHFRGQFPCRKKKEEEEKE